MVQVRVKENSLIAGIAAKKLKVDKVAIVINRTIHLHNTTQEEFKNNEAWLRHELMHVEQYRQYGTIRFITLYLYESLIKGYKQNRFEIEARSAELDKTDLSKYNIQ